MSKNDIIKLAEKQIGIRAKDKYHKQIIDGYNKVIPRPRGYKVSLNDDWCDVFITWLADKTGQANLIGRECGVQRHLQIFKNKGIWKGRTTPKAGDIVVFDWQGYNAGWADHIGLVTNVNGNTITTVEGNTGNPRGVRRKTYNKSSNYIVGYARPNYKTSGSSGTGKKSIDTVAKEVIAGKWGNNPQRKQKLEKDGYNYSAVQKRVNELSKNKSIDKVAKQVIAGKWGNNPQRKQKLEKAGYNYSAVQKRVNELSKK